MFCQLQGYNLFKSFEQQIQVTLQWLLLCYISKFYNKQAVKGDIHVPAEYYG